MSTATLPFIEISGEPRERGRQYGEAAREQIRRSIAFYRDAYSRAAKLSWDEVLDRAPRWVPLIDDYLPGITDEVHGIAEGAGSLFADILALNGRGELSAATRSKSRRMTAVRRSPSWRKPPATATCTAARTGTGAAPSPTRSWCCASCSQANRRSSCTPRRARLVARGRIRPASG